MLGAELSISTWKNIGRRYYRPGSIFFAAWVNHVDFEQIHLYHATLIRVNKSPANS